MKNDLRNALIGAVLGLLAAWLLGFFRSAPVPAAVPAAPTASTATPVKPSAGAAVVVSTRPPAVALPTQPPVKASQSTPAAPPAQAAAPSAEQAAQFAKIRQQSQTKAILNNLRQLSSAAQQYMMEHGVTSAGYYDLVGTTTDSYLRNVAPVAGEDYSGFYMNQTDTQVMIVTPDGNTVTFNQ